MFLEVICLECADKICYRCGLFGKHKGHKTTPLDQFMDTIE